MKSRKQAIPTSSPQIPIERIGDWRERVPKLPRQAERFPLFQRRSVADELSSTYITFLPFNPGFRRRRLLLLVRKRGRGRWGRTVGPGESIFIKPAKQNRFISRAAASLPPPSRGKGWSNIVERRTRRIY